MPIPSILVCATNSSIDDSSRQASMFNIVDHIAISKIDTEQSDKIKANGLTLHVLASWLKAEGDSVDETYEAQLSILLPHADSEFVIMDVKINIPKPVHRLISRGDIVNFFGPGIMKVISRIRKPGEEWIIKEQSILIFESKTVSLTAPNVPPQPSSQSPSS